MADYTSDELVRQIGVPLRIFRYWFEVGLLPTPEYHGNQTRYPESTFVRAKAIAAMRKEGLRIPAIKRWLKKAQPAEVALKAGVQPPAPPNAPKGAAANAPNAKPAERPALDLAILPAPAEAPTNWMRIALVPGMELHVRADAGALVARLAGEIAERYRAR